MPNNKGPLAYKEGHTYYIVLKDEENNNFIGKATCCEEDYDFESEKIGYTIAHLRAVIKTAKYGKRKLKHELKALKQLYYSVNMSKHFNPKGYMEKMLYRQIQQKEDDIEALNDAIKDIQQNITMFIEKKDKYHNQVRAMREKKVK